MLQKDNQLAWIGIDPRRFADSLSLRSRTGAWSFDLMRFESVETCWSALRRVRRTGEQAKAFVE